MKQAYLSLLLAFGLLGAAYADDIQPPTLPLGSLAPDFSLPAVDGHTYSLKDFADAKLLVVLFTCNHCPTAQAYEGRIKQLVADYKAKGVAVVAINANSPAGLRLDEMGWSDVGDSFADMKIRASDHEFNFPYLYDGDTEVVGHAYGPVATPHAFVFDTARKLRYVGAVDDSERIKNMKKPYLRDALEALLAGREPAVTSTKVAGCSIKWAAKADKVKADMEKLAAEPVSVSPADEQALKDLRQNKGTGKFRLVNFWATWCAPCQAEFDEFVTINRMFRQREFELVTVSLNQPDEQKSVLSFLQKKQSSGRNLIFASNDRDKLINAFEPEWQGEVPYTVLIAPDGKIVYRETGRVDELALKRAIISALNGLN